MTSLGARAMRVSGAVNLVRSTEHRAPLFAALRCPWMSAPCKARGARPFCARGPLSYLQHKYNRTVQ